MSVEEILDLLEDVNWDRTDKHADGTLSAPWEGIAGKFTPSGTFSIGGPKEVGHAVADALADPEPAAGQGYKVLIRTERRRAGASGSLLFSVVFTDCPS